MTILNLNFRMENNGIIARHKWTISGYFFIFEFRALQIITVAVYILEQKTN